jgi:hypothetical protein
VSLRSTAVSPHAEDAVRDINVRYDILKAALDAGADVTLQSEPFGTALDLAGGIKWI